MGTWGLRLKPGRVDQVIPLLSENVIAIGWSDSDQLLNRPLSKDDFRAILKRDYPDENLANALEHTWRFIREIALGDVAAVPHGDDVYFVQIAGDAYSEPAGADTDTVIRRPIIRLLDGKPLARHGLPQSLQDKLAFPKTSANLKAVESVVSEVLKAAGHSREPLAAIETRGGTASAMSAWRKAFNKVGRTDHGFSERTVWVEELNIWLTVGGWERKDEHRYWNGLGDRLGSNKTRNLIVEVNPPDGGPPRRWQGLAASDEKGGVWILHSGEMNVGGTRVQLSDPQHKVRHPRKLVKLNTGEIIPYFVVAQIGSDHMNVVRQTARFMQACARVRSRVTETAVPEFIEAQEAALLLEESIGITTVPAQPAKAIERVHARIWHAVRKDLEGKGYRVANQRVGSLGPDLYTIGRGTRYLIEIKTAVSASDYLKAVGQLLVYEKRLKRDYRKILILPKGMRATARDVLVSLDIAIVDYDDLRSRVIFHWGSALDQ